MRILAFAIVAIATASPVASAQRSATDSIQASKRVEYLTDQLHDILFRGIPLSAPVDSSARGIIRDAVLKRDRLDWDSPSVRAQATMLVQQRDSLLRALLTSDDERRRFATNARSRMFIIDGDVRMNPPPSDTFNVVSRRTGAVHFNHRGR